MCEYKISLQYFKSITFHQKHFILSVPKLEWRVKALPESEQRYFTENSKICLSKQSPKFEFLNMSYAGHIYLATQNLKYSLVLMSPKSSRPLRLAINCSRCSSQSLKQTIKKKFLKGREIDKKYETYNLYQEG